MARALSHLHSLIRGSVGGLTYFSNQFHQICMRQRTAPVQPNTVWQVGIRSAFNLAETFWEALDEAERDDWRFYANSCVYPGPAGAYTVPGRQLMIGTLALSIYAQAIEPDVLVIAKLAPIISGWFNPGQIFAGVYMGPTQGIAVVIQNQDVRPGIMVVDHSLAFNPTRTRFKGPWFSSDKNIKAFPPVGQHTVTIDLPAGMLNKAVFTRTRAFTGADTLEPIVPHALAFPMHLRHICLAPPVNGPTKPKKEKAKTAK